MDKLPKDFYLLDTLTVARELLGAYLVRRAGEQLIAGRITETEAYIGAIDKACHAYGGRLTPRTKIMFEPGGCAYIYFIYGMYYCMNVVTEPEGCGCAVLIRGLDLAAGHDIAARFRYGEEFENLSSYRLKNFSNGPGKLCKALNLTKEQNGEDLTGSLLYITKTFPGITNSKYTIHTGKRIGIGYAEEAQHFMWRFFIK